MGNLCVRLHHILLCSWKSYSLYSCLSFRLLTDCSLALTFLLVYSFAAVPVIIVNLCPQHVREVLWFFEVFCLFVKEKVQMENLSWPMLTKYLDICELKTHPQTNKQTNRLLAALEVFFLSAHSIPQVPFLPCLFPSLHHLNSSNRE